MEIFWLLWLPKLDKKKTGKQFTLTDNNTKHFSKLFKHINLSNIYYFVNLLENERKENEVDLETYS